MTRPDQMKRIVGFEPPIPLTLMPPLLHAVGEWHASSCTTPGCGAYMRPGPGGVPVMEHGVVAGMPVPGVEFVPAPQPALVVGDTVRSDEVPLDLMDCAVDTIERAVPNRFPPGEAGRAEMAEVVAAVLFAVGHHLIGDDVQSALERKLVAADVLLPAAPFDCHGHLSDITWALLNAIGVRSL
jgi:hypothetical protein